MMSPSGSCSILGLLNFVNELGAGVFSSSCSRIYKHIQDSPSLASTSVPKIGSHPSLLSSSWRWSLLLGGSHVGDTGDLFLRSFVYDVLGIFVDGLPRAMRVLCVPASCLEGAPSVVGVVLGFTSCLFFAEFLLGFCVDRC